MERLDFGRSFTYMFEDSEWLVKLLVAAFIFFVSLLFSVVVVGLVGFLVLSGYMVAIIRQVARGEDLPLPRWADFGILFMDGLRVGVATFIWSLPAFIFYLPILVVSLLASGGSDTMSVLLGLITLACGCLLLLYSLFLAVVSPVVVLRVATTQRLGAAFDFAEIFEFVRTYIGPIILVVVGSLVAQIVAGLVGVLLCGLGILVTLVWAMWVEGHLIGQLGRLQQPAVQGEVVSP